MIHAICRKDHTDTGGAPAGALITEPDNHHNALVCGYCSQGLAEHYRAEVIREVLDWIEARPADGDAIVRSAGRHFGVSS